MTTYPWYCDCQTWPCTCKSPTALEIAKLLVEKDIVKPKDVKEFLKIVEELEKVCGK